MGIYVDIYNKFVETSDVDDKDIISLMMYLQKNHECEFKLTFTKNIIPRLDCEGYTTSIKVGDAIMVMVTTRRMHNSIKTALVKFKNIMNLEVAKE